MPCYCCHTLPIVFCSPSVLVLLESLVLLVVVLLLGGGGAGSWWRRLSPSCEKCQLSAACLSLSLSGFWLYVHCAPMPLTVCMTRRATLASMVHCCCVVPSRDTDRCSGFRNDEDGHQQLPLSWRMTFDFTKKQTKFGHSFMLGNAASSAELQRAAGEPQVTSGHRQTKTGGCTRTTGKKR